jgi:osmotically-inducible protein OsmY
MQILPLTTSTPARGVEEQAQRRLRESPYYFLKQVSCHFEAGVLTLRGTVPLWQLRQFAESIVSRVEGVRSIENEVEVFDPLAEPIEVRAARSA